MRGFRAVAMADLEKATEPSKSSLENDLTSTKSKDSKSNDLGIVFDFERRLDLEKDSDGANASPDVEKGSSSSEQDTALDSNGEDPNLVVFDENDPENPMNFTLWQKVWMSTMASYLTFAVSFSSSVFSADTKVTAEKFGVSEEVMVLGVSLYVLGFACGKKIATDLHHKHLTRQQVLYSSAP